MKRALNRSKRGKHQCWNGSIDSRVDSCTAPVGVEGRAPRPTPPVIPAATGGRAHQLLVPAVVHRIATTFEPARTAPRQQKDDAATGQNSLVVSA